MSRPLPSRALPARSTPSNPALPSIGPSPPGATGGPPPPAAPPVLAHRSSGLQRRGYAADIVPTSQTAEEVSRGKEYHHPTAVAEARQVRSQPDAPGCTTPRGRRRAAIVQEIVSSEQVYCTHLLRLYCLYSLPLPGSGLTPPGQQWMDEVEEWQELLGGADLRYLQASVEAAQSKQGGGKGSSVPILSSEEGECLWPGLPAILQLHKTLLQALGRALAPFQGQAQDTEPGLGSLAAVSAVAGVFLRHGPFLKLLAPYCSGHGRALVLLARLRSERPALDAWARAVEAGAGSAGQSLESLLVMPVQRVPRYILLLQELAKACPGSPNGHQPEGGTEAPVLEQVHKAIELVQQAASALDSSIAASEAQRGVLQWQGRLTPPPEPSLVSPGRLMLKQGMLQKLCKPGSRWKAYAAGLFSEGPLLVYAQGSVSDGGKGAQGDGQGQGEEGGGSGTGIGTGHGPLKVHGILTVVGVEQVQGTGTQLKVLARPKSIVVRCKEESEAAAWLHALQHALLPPARTARWSQSLQQSSIHGPPDAVAAGSTATSTATGTPRVPLPVGSGRGTTTPTTTPSARPSLLAGNASASARGSEEGQEEGLGETLQPQWMSESSPRAQGSGGGGRSVHKHQHQRVQVWGHVLGQQHTAPLPLASAASISYSAPYSERQEGGPPTPVPAHQGPLLTTTSQHGPVEGQQRPPSYVYDVQGAVTVGGGDEDSLHVHLRGSSTMPMGQKPSFFKANASSMAPQSQPTRPASTRPLAVSTATTTAGTRQPYQHPQQAAQQGAATAAVPRLGLGTQSTGVGAQQRMAMPDPVAAGSATGARPMGMQSLAQRWGSGPPTVAPPAGLPMAVVHSSVHAPPRPVQLHVHNPSGQGRQGVSGTGPVRLLGHHHPESVSTGSGGLREGARSGLHVGPGPGTCAGTGGRLDLQQWPESENPEQAAAALRAMIAAEDVGSAAKRRVPIDATAAMLMQRHAGGAGLGSGSVPAWRTMHGAQTSPYGDPFAELDPFRRQ